MTTLRRLCTLTVLTLALALAGCETSNDGTGDVGDDAATPDTASDTGVDTTLPPEDIVPDPGNPDLPPPVDATDAAETADAAEAIDATETTDATDATDTGLPPDCCHTNEECGPNAYCVAGHLGAGGVCHTEQLPDGSCFVDADCGGEELGCKGEQLCSCDMNCISHAGSCLPAWGSCCFTDAHCDAGQICAGEGPGGLPGACKEPAPLGACWDDGECGLGATCEGEAICPCDAMCDMEDTPGTCELSAGCCQSDDDCLFPVDQGFVCAGFDLDPAGLTGTCVMAAQPGECWDDLDCGLGQICSGSSLCPCGAMCGVIEMPGACVAAPDDDCCFSDADCDAGQFCLAHTRTCVADLDPGHCFTNADCGGAACVGATFCSCGDLCFVGTSPGACQELPLGCCISDLDCGLGLVCRAEGGLGGLPGSCVPDPQGPECLGDVACCWDDGDCPGGSMCQNVMVCGCIELCPMCGQCAPDQMGTCGN